MLTYYYYGQNSISYLVLKLFTDMTDMQPLNKLFRLRGPQNGHFQGILKINVCTSSDIPYVGGGGLSWLMPHRTKINQTPYLALILSIN